MPAALSAHFAHLLAEQAFTFSPAGFMAIHRRLFDGALPEAGRLRAVDAPPYPEWVLGGEAVLHASASELEETLAYEFAQEKRFPFHSLGLDEVIEHLAAFLATLWQIHPFDAGNAQVVAVFAVRYLRSLGFDVDGQAFISHFRFFRNALVRAIYRNFRQRVMPDAAPLVAFLRHAALGECHELDNRSLCVGEPLPEPEPSAPPAPERRRKVWSADPEEASELHPRQRRLLRTLGGQVLGVPELLHALRLTTRQSFMRVWLSPAMEMGLVKPLHPESPRHPQQKYLLTRKGQRFMKQLIRKS